MVGVNLVSGGPEPVVPGCVPSRSNENPRPPGIPTNSSMSKMGKSAEKFNQAHKGARHQGQEPAETTNCQNRPAEM